jgi:hypothetical protein
MLFGVLTAGLVLATAGCASNAIVGTGVVRSGLYFGNVGVTGHGSSVTILHGSKVPKLSIIGNNTTVTVEDGVVLHRIEFWGKGNTVSIPENLIVRTTEVGANQIIRRPRETTVSSESSSWERTTPAYTPPAEPQSPPTQAPPPSETPRKPAEPASDDTGQSPAAEAVEV